MTTANLTARELFLNLVAMRNEVGEKLYQRLVMAQKLLADTEWVEDVSAGGGDESIALDRLEEECFGDLCGSISLPDMLEVLRRVPDKKTWKANKFNLRRMWAEMKARNKTASPPLPPKGERVEGEDSRDRLIRRLREELAELKQSLRNQIKENLKLKAAIHRIQQIQESVAV